MRRIVIVAIVCAFTALSGMMVQWLLPSARTQEGSTSVLSGPQADISNQKLKAFAKVYVAYHKLQREYETSLRSARDSKQREMIQQEANSKLGKVLDKQGLTPEDYNDIFAAVNANEGLRKKALELIEEERKIS